MEGGLQKSKSRDYWNDQGTKRKLPGPASWQWNWEVVYRLEMHFKVEI